MNLKSNNLIINFLLITIPFSFVFIANWAGFSHLYHHNFKRVIFVFILYLIAFSAIHYLYVTRKLYNSAFWYKIAIAIVLEFALGYTLYTYDNKEQNIKSNSKVILNDILYKETKIENHISQHKSLLYELYGKDYVDFMYNKSSNADNIFDNSSKIENINNFLISKECLNTERQAKIVAGQDFPILEINTTGTLVFPKYELNKCSTRSINHIIQQLETNSQEFKNTQDELRELKNKQILNESGNNQENEKYLSDIILDVIKFLISNVLGTIFVIIALILSSGFSSIFYKKIIFKNAETDKVFPRELILSQLLKIELTENNQGAYNFLKDKRIVWFSKIEHSDIIKQLHIRGEGMNKCHIIQPKEIDELIKFNIIDTSYDLQDIVFYAFSKDEFDKFFVYNSRIDQKFYTTNPNDKIMDKIMKLIKIYWFIISLISVLIVGLILMLFILL